MNDVIAIQIGGELNAGPFKGGGYIVVRGAGPTLDAQLEFL